MILIKNFISKLMSDILRDKDSSKYSITKTIALISFLMLAVILVFATYIMLKNKEVDYFLIGEMMFFILTLLGFKNLRPAPDYKNVDVNKKNEVHD